jgi:serine protease Do
MDQPAGSVSENNQQAYQGKISEVAARVSPSVVGISNMQKDGDMFGQDSIESTGSGVILDHEGYIITNNHVVKGADSITVTLADGNEEQAKIVGTDPRTDLAVIKIKVDNHVTPIVFGDSDKLIVGQEVIAIGNPLGLRFARSVTSGIVSGLNRLVSTEEGFLFKLIQTDAAINPGNSGGALVNLNGELIGINTIKIAEKGFEGMGFSIPSNQVKAVVQDIKKYGKVTRPLMGIRIIGEISPEKARYYGISKQGGVVVEPITGQAADKAGLQVFDIITRIDGKEVSTGLDLQEYIFEKKIGDKVDVEIIRLDEAGTNQIKNHTIRITLSK